MCTLKMLENIGSRSYEIRQNLILLFPSEYVKHLCLTSYALNDCTLFTCLCTVIVLAGLEQYLAEDGSAGEMSCGIAVPLCESKKKEQPHPKKRALSVLLYQ